MSSTSQITSAAVRPRFTWPVRIVIFLVLFHMFFRSTDVLYPWEDWLSELKIERMPRPLPTREQLAKLRENADGSYAPVIEEFKKSFASLPGYWNPTPKGETLELLSATQIRWDGLRLNPLSAKQRADHKLPANVGLLVMAVDDDSPGQKAGLKPGDVITKIGDQTAWDEIDRLSSISQIGLDLMVLRDGKEERIGKVSFDTGPSISQGESVFLWIKYGLAFALSRLQWCECLLNIDQEWPMFSPNVGKRKYPARARLLYADGTEITIRQRSDPGDLLWYIRWSPGKNLGYDRGVSDDSGSRWYACPGWCNYLSHQHSHNESGAPLKEIRIYQVRYDFLPPGEEPHAFFRKQMEATLDHKTISEQVYTTFFRYWPETKRYEFVRAKRTIQGLTPLEGP